MNHLRRILRRLLLPALALCALLLIVPALALAATEGGGKTSSFLFLSPAVIWTLLVSAVTPLIGYVVNSKLWAQASEPVKGAVTAIITGLATAGTEAAATNVLGWNVETLGLILLAELAAFKAWHPIWKTTGVQPRLVAPRTQG